MRLKPRRHQGAVGASRRVPGGTGALTGLFVLVLGFGLTGCGPSAVAFGGACVNLPGQVEAGSNGSLYIGERSTVVHYSDRGKLLATIPATDGTFAVDKSGDIYVLSGKDIERASGTGQVLFRFGAPMYEPETVDSTGDILAVYGGNSYAGGQRDTVATYSPAVLVRKWASVWDGVLGGRTARNALCSRWRG